MELNWVKFWRENKMEDHNITLSEAINLCKTYGQKDEMRNCPMNACKLVDKENNRILLEAFKELPEKIRLRFATEAFKHYQLLGYGDVMDPFIWAECKVILCDGRQIPELKEVI
jgi:hypothetical protein